MPHVVFDFGAVLFDWQPRRLLQRLLPQQASDDTAAAHWAAQIFQGYGGDWAEFDRGALDAPGVVARIAARTGLAAAALRQLVDAVPDALTPLPASVALLERVRAWGRPVYFLSNMPAPYADELERRHGFVRGFDAGVFSARVGLIKPDPAIFVLAAQRFGQPAGELLLLDDHPANVEAARAAGWQALVFRDAAQAEADLRRDGHWPPA